ncbi:MAG: ROK family protein [Armatimonadetes bacterium]|nr:ROK family protein [Armatimonadota bacterium]
MNLNTNRSGRYAVGIDLGGTNIRVALSNLEGRILHEVRRPTPSLEPGRATVARIVNAIDEALEREKITRDEVVGIGMGIPGIMDPDLGLIYWSPNFPEWSEQGEPVGKDLSEETGLATFIINDARCAALGELHYGAGRGARYMVMITVGTGIGGAIVMDGKLMLGPQGSIGEIGHHTIDPHGPRCGCGNFGCMEALCNIRSIVERCVAKIQAGRPSQIREQVGGDWEKITPALIDEAADDGDALAREVMEETGMWIGIGVSNMINILNPEVFVIGGGVSQAGDTLFDPIRRTVAARAVKLQASHCRIVPAELGDEAGMRGAVALVMERLREQSA